MYDVFKGVKVVEAATYLAVPAAGAIMASWGAEVIKIEHPETGDPYRAMRTVGMASGWDIANRGKKSLAIDIKTPGGLAIMRRLVESADVLLTNLRDSALQRSNLLPADVWAWNPRLIFAGGTAYGRRGPDSDKGGFDGASSWARGGLGYRSTPEGADDMTQQPGSIGDLVTAVSLAGGIAAALYQREKTGKGITVDTSLYHTGIWLASQSIETRSPMRGNITPLNPLLGTYWTSDDRGVVLCLIQSDKDFPSLCRHLDRLDMLDDPRFRTHADREANRDACRAELERTFAKRTFGEWREALKTFTGPWSPVLSPAEVADDDQARVNGYVIDSYAGTAVCPPVQFGGEHLSAMQAPPEHGEDTEAVLADLGLSSDEIMDLRIEGAVL